MDVAELQSLRQALEEFMVQFDECIKTSRSRAHLRRYVSGQVSDLERKSIEPMALAAGVPPRTLQEFLSIHRWDERRVAQRLRANVKRNHPSDNAIAVIDETSYPKKGDKTPGVQRQYCGANGKTDNCVVTVHLGYVTEDFHGLLDGDLYLPKDTWSEDRKRCREARIPDDVVYRAKWRIALELLERSRSEGIPMGWLTADEGYGRAREFREGVAALGLTYVVEIPSSLIGWTRKPKVHPAGARTASGRRLRKPRLAEDEREPRAVSRLWHRGGPSWVRYQTKTTQKGPLVWEVRDVPFFPNREGVPGQEERLIIAREVLSGEVKYFLSNAGPQIPLQQLLVVAFSRWHIERLFEDAKGEIGLDHFEVRNYRSLMRHLTISMLSLCFLCEQTTRLRGGKPVVDSLTDQGGDRSPTRPEDAAA
jgi:SRSO17 transposase